jgi:hypothetical protein
MPQIIYGLAAVVAIIVAVGLAVTQAIHVTAPVASDHAAVLEACNGAVEVGAIVGADPNAANQLKSATQATGTITGGATPLPVTARVAGSEYVVTVGSGRAARTCHVPLVSRDL